MSISFIPREFYPHITIICKMKKQRMLDSYYEVHVTPTDPAAPRIPPVVVKAERRPAEVHGSPGDPNYLYQLLLSYKKARRIYKSVVRKAVETRNRLVKQYDGQDYEVTLVQKRL